MLGPSLHKFVKFKNIRQINSQYLTLHSVQLGFATLTEFVKWTIFN